MEQIETNMDRNFSDDPDVNETIEKFLNAVEYVLFFPLSYGINCMAEHGCLESDFVDDEQDEQTISSASFYTNVNQNAGDNGSQHGVD